MWSPFTEQKRSMKGYRGVNRKHASAESGIWNLAFKHHIKIWNLTWLCLVRFQIFLWCLSQIPNFTLCRSVFALKHQFKNCPCQATSPRPSPPRHQANQQQQKHSKSYMQFFLNSPCQPTSPLKPSAFSASSSGEPKKSSTYFSFEALGLLHLVIRRTKKILHLLLLWSPRPSPPRHQANQQQKTHYKKFKNRY